VRVTTDDSYFVLEMGSRSVHRKADLPRRWSVGFRKF